MGKKTWGSAAIAGLVLAGAAYCSADNPEAEPSRRIGCNESATVPISDDKPGLVGLDYEKREKIGKTNRTTVFDGLVTLSLRGGGIDGVDIAAKYHKSAEPIDAHIKPKGHDRDNNLFPGGPEEKGLDIFPKSKGSSSSLLVSVDVTSHGRGSADAIVAIKCINGLYDHAR